VPPVTNIFPEREKLPIFSVAPVNLVYEKAHVL